MLKTDDLYFNFPEALHLLTHYSNSIGTMKFLDTHNNIEIYREKGYLYFYNESTNTYEANYCMDYSQDKTLLLHLNDEKMPVQFYLDICKFIINSKTEEVGD
jgi:hypothetical protein